MERQDRQEPAGGDPLRLPAAPGHVTAACTVTSQLCTVTAQLWAVTSQALEANLATQALSDWRSGSGCLGSLPDSPWCPGGGSLLGRWPPGP
eukprot:2538186-Rhodomonas_salina.3